MPFTNKQKTEHYKKVAAGKIKPKKVSKFSAKEQKSYAQGQVDARRDIAKSKATNKRSRNYRG